MVEKMVCAWRVSRALPSGMQVWFDPETEVVKLYRLPLTSDQAGVDRAHQLAVLAQEGEIGYLDKVASVSGSEVEVEPASSRHEQISLIEDPGDLPF